MRIERFRIQGFKSLADVTVEGLSDINVFFGLNDVGKSNIFEALALWRWFLQKYSPRSNNGTIDFKDIESEFGPALFRLGGNEKINLSVSIALGEQKSLDIGIDISRQNDKCRYAITGGRNARIVDQLHFRIIDAARRFQKEQRTNGNRIEPISDSNLKEALFYAYLSSDLAQKRRLASIRKILSEAPFNLGELDIALDPATDEIDIGFVRSDGRLLLDKLGSGSQQLLLILGQVFLNDTPIIALEEPEMNLSPQHQEHLMLALRTLMQDPAVKLEQLFISTHSPYFEFTENFYDVTLDANGATQVSQATKVNHTDHFSFAPIGPDNGARLNSLNQVMLYDRLIDDLGLKRGDLVMFVPNEQGRWEVRAGNEMADELESLISTKQFQIA